MNISQLLHRTFKQSAKYLDKRNHNTIIEASVTLCKYKQLSIAELGRGLKSTALVKHNIKRIDRLFGNRNVQNNRIHYYRTVASVAIGHIDRPIISIDWSGLTPCGEFHLLRAASPAKGRTITIFEQSFREAEYMKQSTHKAFLKSLQAILPKECYPIIVTDAGFRNPWFKLILSMKWDFVGRLRHQTQYQIPQTDQWEPIKSLYKKASSMPKFLFKTALAKANSLDGHFYLFKEKPKNRKNKNLRGKAICSSVSLKHAKGAQEPWLIFTSLMPEYYNAKKVIHIYRQRMQIEEAFRDLKNTNNGLNFRNCRSYAKGRLDVALLIRLLASFILWLAGLVAKKQKLHYSFQANTIKSRNVLSCFIIGTQYFRRYGYKISWRDYSLAIQTIKLDCQVEL